MPKNINYMPSLLDREIESPDKDAFGHRHFAKALESLIEAPGNSPPFSIGLLGGWGTGKSTIKAIYLRQLKDDINRSKKRHPIIFNAWRFGGENIKRALLRHVFLEIEGEESSLKDALFREIQKLVPEKRNWHDILKDIAQKWGWSLAQITLVTLIMVGFARVVSWLFDFPNKWALALIVAIYFSIEFGKYMLSPQRFIISRYSNLTKIEPPMSTIEEFEDLLLEQLKKYKSGKTKSKKGKGCERLVIFVDDLDRLSREEMVSGLDAIRSFMEIPKEKLPPDLGIVFVVSCDEERLAAALARRQPDMPGAVFTRSDARRFLDRIFQFRLEIPSFPKRDMRNYATKKLNEDLKEIFDDLKQREVSIEALIDRMIHVGVQTPRNALQILNAFAQCWWLASKREFDGAGTEVPGGLQEGAVTNHPYALAALCAIRVDFPDFYDHLQREPELIKRFTNVFLKGGELKDQPESAQDILKNYFDANNNLKPEYNSLRQFISGLQGLRWPPSLQPLLLLTQDPVTRKFGDKGPRLYNALVSGDDFSVLVELGRDKDSNPLTTDEVRLLHDMDEELHHETSVFRDNAAAAIAGLSKRLPYDQAHILLSSIAQRLSVSPELRWRLGVKKISDIIPHALPDNRKEVAENLINDLLKKEGDINFKLESGEPPSLDEALEMAHTACSLALSVREQDGLDEKPDAVLLNWLETRRVSINKKEAHLPFSDLENWMDEYENSLLSALGGRYTKLLADQLEEEDQIESLVIANIARRSQSVFDSLMMAGEESRKELWQHLSRFMSTKPPEIVALAWNFINLHLKTPDSQELTILVKIFSQRLVKDMEDSDNWGLDWENAGQVLLNIIEKRQKDITQEGQEALANLANSWALVEDTANLATRLLEHLCVMNRNYCDNVISSWIAKIISDLPEDCVNWLSRNFITTLNESQRTQITNQFNILYQRNNISEDEGIRFHQVVSNLSEESLKCDTFQKYLGQLFQFISQQHSNPNDYLYRVFSPIPPIIKNGPPSHTGNMLDTLFNQAAALPTVYGWLHDKMAEFWLKPAGDLGPYNPVKIFDQAKNIANQHPNDPSAFGILRSMREMITQAIVSQDKTMDVIEIACLLWPFQQRESLKTFKTFELVPDLHRLTNLMDSVDTSDEEKKNNLVEAWTHFSKLLNDEQLSQVTKLILGKPLKGTEAEPDLLLRIWIVVQGERKNKLLGNLIVTQDLNDDQRKRIWLQIEQSHQELGKDFFLNVLPKIFELQDSLETFNAVFQTAPTLTSLFPSKEDKYDLGRVLLKAFFSTQSIDAKNRLLTMLNNLGAEDVLAELRNIGEPSGEDIEILKNHFPKSRHLT